MSEQQEVQDMTALADGLSPLSRLFSDAGFFAERYDMVLRTIEEPPRRYRVQLIPDESQPRAWEQRFTALPENDIPFYAGKANRQ